MLASAAAALLLLISWDARAEDATSFVTRYCADCHQGADAEAGIDFENLKPASKASVDLWQSIASQVVSRNMPPADSEFPDDEEVQAFAASVRKQLQPMGLELEIDYKQHQPAYANLLNHDRLFDREAAGKRKQPVFSKPRLWRLHPQAYDAFLNAFGNQLGKGGPLSKPFLVGDGKGVISNYARLMRADEATLSQLMLNCQQIATFQTIGFRKMEQDRKAKAEVEKIYMRRPESFAAILESETPATDQQLRAAVAEEFQIVLRREPSESEASQFMKLLREASDIGGKERGLRTLAMAVLLRPEAIFRMEVGLSKPDKHGRRMLSPHELAHAIAFALSDTPPDKFLIGPPRERDRNQRPTEPSLTQLAKRGELSTREDVARVVATILESDNIEKPQVLRFFREFFGYHTAETVFKGDRAGKEFNTKILVKDADMLVLHHVQRDRNVLRELLTTDKFFVQWPGSIEEYDRRVEYITKRIKPDNTKDRNYKYFVSRVASGLKPIPQANPTWRQTVRFYNFDESKWDYPTQQPVKMPDGQRSGILTHPAWLAAWSGNFENDPIRRGKWIRDHLLAGAVPDIPITVNAAVPEDAHKTLRERLSVTRQEYCWQCHQKMDPLGLPFEMFDDFGQHRTREGLGQTRALKQPKTSANVDASGEIVASGESDLDGAVAGPRELMHRLADSSRVRQSFVRHAFRFWMGRNETLRDASVLISADDAYTEGQGSFKALVIDLLTSDSFLYRK